MSDDFDPCGCDATVHRCGSTSWSTYRPCSVQAGTDPRSLLRKAQQENEQLRRELDRLRAGGLPVRALDSELPGMWEPADLDSHDVVRP